MSCATPDDSSSYGPGCQVEEDVSVTLESLGDYRRRWFRRVRGGRGGRVLERGDHALVDGKPAVADEVGEFDVLLGHEHGDAMLAQRLDRRHESQYHDGREPL